MGTLKAVLIDLDGVIRRWDPGQTAQAELDAGLPAGTLLGTAFAPDLLQPAITGLVDDEVWRARVQARLQRDYPEADAARAVQAWSEPAGAVDAATLEVVRACRARTFVVLVTNATSRLPRDLHRLRLAEEFDHIINSSVVGHVKPGAEIFHAALEQAGVAATSALFVDDQHANVAAAQALGLHGHVFTTVDLFHDVLARHGLV